MSRDIRHYLGLRSGGGDPAAVSLWRNTHAGYVVTLLPDQEERTMKPGHDQIVTAIAYVQTHPDEHDQDYWGAKGPCGTIMCLAGHIAVTLNGARPKWESIVFKGERGVGFSQVFPFRKRTAVDVDTYAAELAGLDEWGSNGLFSSDDDDYFEAAAEILGLTARGLQRKVNAEARARGWAA